MCCLFRVRKRWLTLISICHQTGSQKYPELKQLHIYHNQKTLEWEYDFYVMTQLQVNGHEDGVFLDLSPFVLLPVRPTRTWFYSCQMDFWPQHPAPQPVLAATLAPQPFLPARFDHGICNFWFQQKTERNKNHSCNIFVYDQGRHRFYVRFETFNEFWL